MNNFWWTSKGISLLEQSTGVELLQQVIPTTTDGLFVDIRDRTGRGDTVAGSARSANLKGRGSTSGKMINSQLPIPTNLPTGVYDMVYTLNQLSSATGSALTITVSAVISEFKATRDPKKQNSPDVEFSFVHIGNYRTPTGTLSAVTVNLPVKELDSGDSKTFDPFKIGDRATMRYDFPQVADTDAAELTAVSAVYTDAATYPIPVPGLKPRSATFIKTDRPGGAVQAQYSRLNTSDDVLNPRTGATYDPKFLQSKLHLDPQLFDPNDSPPAASPPAGYKTVTFSDAKVDDVVWVRAFIYGLNDSADEAQNPHITTSLDSSDFNTHGSLSQIFDANTAGPAAPSPPIAGLVLTWTNDVKLTAIGPSLPQGQKLRVWLFEKITARRRLELQHSGTLIDSPGHLLDEGTNAAVDATPATTSGFQDRGLQVVNITSGHELNIRHMGTRTPTQDIEMPLTRTIYDPSKLQTAEQVGKVYNTSAISSLAKNTAFVTPASGTVFKTISLHPHDARHTIAVQTDAVATTYEDATQPHTFTRQDQYGVVGEGQATKVVATSTFNQSVLLSSITGLAIPTNQTFVTATAQPLDHFNTRIIQATAIDSPKQQIESRGNVSTRSGQRPYTTIGVLVVPNYTATANTLADDVAVGWPWFQTQTNAFGLRAYKENNRTGVIAYEFVDPGQQLRGQSDADSRWVQARLNGTDLQAFVARNRAIASGKRGITFSSFQIQQYRSDFILRRMLQGTSIIPIQNPATIDGTTMPNVGDINSVAFLAGIISSSGIPVNQCIYRGPFFETNLTLASTRSYDMSYRFEWDTNGIFNTSLLMGYEYTLATSVSTEGDWVTLSSLGLTNYVTQPTASSFAAFTA